MLVAVDIVGGGEESFCRLGGGSIFIVWCVTSPFGTETEGLEGFSEAGQMRLN